MTQLHFTAFSSADLEQNDFHFLFASSWLKASTYSGQPSLDSSSQGRDRHFLSLQFIQCIQCLFLHAKAKLECVCGRQQQMMNLKSQNLTETDCGSPV